MGVALPSFLIIAVISFALGQFENLRAVKFAFAGIRAGVLALLVKALASMYKQCPWNKMSYIMAVFAFLCVAFFEINVLIVIIICAVIGLTYSIITERREKH